MRVSIIVTDDGGNTYHGELELSATPKASTKRRKHPPTPKTTSKPGVNFSTPIRAFVKQHGHDMSGSQRFALVVAYLSKGESHKEVPMTVIEKQWNRMKPLLGGKLNRAHSTRAKENGWVDSSKHGVYVLLPGWKGIFDA